MAEDQRDRPRPGETVAVAADHAGFALKAKLADEIARLGYKTLDFGTNGPDSVDYPDFALAVATSIEERRAAWGVLICGSGIGMSIAANRNSKIRAALCHDGFSARLARQHNNANVLVLGARLIGEDVARDCLQIFLATEFEGGRHARRVAKLNSNPKT